MTFSREHRSRQHRLRRLPRPASRRPHRMRGMPHHSRLPVHDFPAHDGLPVGRPHAKTPATLPRPRRSPRQGYALRELPRSAPREPDAVPELPHAHDFRQTLPIVHPDSAVPLGPSHAWPNPCTRCHPSNVFNTPTTPCSSCHTAPHVGPTDCLTCHWPTVWSDTHFTHPDMPGGAPHTSTSFGGYPTGCATVIRAAEATASTSLTTHASSATRSCTRRRTARLHLAERPSGASRPEGLSSRRS